MENNTSKTKIQVPLIFDVPQKPWLFPFLLGIWLFPHNWRLVPQREGHFHSYPLIALLHSIHFLNIKHVAKMMNISNGLNDKKTKYTLIGVLSALLLMYSPFSSTHRSLSLLEPSLDSSSPAAASPWRLILVSPRPTKLTTRMSNLMLPSFPNHRMSPTPFA